MDTDIKDLTDTVNELLMDSARSEDPENARFCEASAVVAVGMAILKELRAIRIERREDA